MKAVCLFAVAFSLSVALAQAPVPCRGPVNEAQLTDLLQSQVPKARVRQIIEQCGVTFAVDPAAASRLVAAGADDAIIGLLYRKAPPPTTSPPTTTLPPTTTTLPPRPLENRYGMRFVRIPGGSFMMGCSDGDGECEGNENPRHEARITKSFELQATEVTQGQWQAVMGSNPSRFTDCGLECPVETVSWDEVQGFLGKLNNMRDGYRYRLPTEAEWEYAARGGTTGKYYGDMDAIAWYNRNSGQKTHPTGQKQANGFGLYDMLGNVWEWCGDWYDEDYYRNSQASDPRGPSSGQGRVLRVGSCYNYPRSLRVSNRNRLLPDDRNYNLGFRCAREVSP